jgi:hypothetical protein
VLSTRCTANHERCRLNMKTRETPTAAVNGPETRAAVMSFCEYVVWLKGIHHIYIELFERDDAQNLMTATASMLFWDLNKVIIDYLLIGIARITDPPRTSGRENFTIANLLETIDWPPEVRAELVVLNQKLAAFRDRIAPARNKLIAHLDKASFLGDFGLGEFPEGQDREVMQALEEMCNVMRKATHGEIFGSIGVGGPGDVLDLKKFLLRGLAFDEALSAAPREEQSRLYDALRSAERKVTKPRQK